MKIKTNLMTTTINAAVAPARAVDGVNAGKGPLGPL